MALSGPRVRRSLVALGAGALALTAALGLSAPVAADQPTAGTPHLISASAQNSTREYWTPARMAAATPADATTQDAPADGAPPGTPTGTLFNGVPTVGALFSTTGTKAHFCTASVVLSATRDLLLTAAHCVNGGASGSGYRSNIAFVPGYHNGVAPYGTWAAQSVLVATGWQTSSDPNLDFAFITVAPDANGQRVQDVTGGNQLGVDTGYQHQVTVIGYSDNADQPIECRTSSFYAMPNQQQFNCHGYYDGTSGGPWLIDVNPFTGSGVVIGDIGGYETGGDYEYTSYSPYYSTSILALFVQAQLPS